MGYLIKVIDEDGNDIPFNRLKCDLLQPTNCQSITEITIQLLDDKRQFSDDEIFLIMELLHRAIDYGGSYGKMKKYIDLVDKLNEENSVNK